MFKFIVLTILSYSFLFSCAETHDKTINPQTIQAQDGGVDVGNMSSVVNIPATKAYITVPGSWTYKVDKTTITMTNSGFSTIKAFQSNIDIEPTQTALQNYLKLKFPEQEYEPIKINGLKGFRNVSSSPSKERLIEIYLVSELNDFVRIQAHLSESENGYTEGEKIISTVSLKYKGKAIEDSSPKTFKSDGYTIHYSLFCERSLFSDQDCRGEYIEIDDQFIKTSSGRGRIVDLGFSAETPFDAIKIDGEFLVAPATKIPITDIYSVFSPKDGTADTTLVKAKFGHVYLIRTVKWPFEDLITKLRIDVLEKDTITITYQKLIAVDTTDLQNQIEYMNKNTLQNEMPNKEGTVKLFSKAVSSDGSYSGFSFKYSNSGNTFLPENSVDFEFSNSKILATYYSFGLSGVIAFENKEFSKITKADFKNPYKASKSIAPEVGKTYGIFNHKAGTNAYSVYGVIKVIDIDKKNMWINLSYLRLSIDKTERFQNWIPDPMKDKTGTEFERFSELNYSETLSSPSDKLVRNTLVNGVNTLHLENILYPKETGFFNFGKTDNFNRLTLADLENKKGSYTNTTAVHEGDVIGIYSETYFNKEIQIYKINEIKLDKSISYEKIPLYRAIAKEVAENYNYKDLFDRWWSRW